MQARFGILGREMGDGVEVKMNRRKGWVWTIGFILVFKEE